MGVIASVGGCVTGQSDEIQRLHRVDFDEAGHSGCGSFRPYRHTFFPAASTAVSTAAAVGAHTTSAAAPPPLPASTAAPTAAATADVARAVPVVVDPPRLPSPSSATTAVALSRPSTDSVALEALPAQATALAAVDAAVTCGGTSGDDVQPHMQVFSGNMWSDRRNVVFRAPFSLAHPVRHLASAYAVPTRVEHTGAGTWTCRVRCVHNALADHSWVHVWVMRCVVMPTAFLSPCTT